MNTKSRLNVIIALVVVCAVAAGVAVYAFSHRKPASLKDQTSYTIGLQFGKSLASQNLDLNSKMVARGLRDAIEGRTSPLSEQEMENAMVQLNENRRKQAHEEADRNKIASDAFLAQNALAPGVQRTKDGLQYKVITEGVGRSPKPDNIVTVNYRGTLIDGKEFDSSYKRGVPAQFPLKGVMPGWREGIELMKKGGKSIIYVPPDLAYGDRPRQNIPANAVLIFEVELLDFH